MTRSALISTLLARLYAGCGGSGGNADQQGRRARRGQAPGRSTLQATDAGSDEAQYLARRIEQRSAGTLEVRLAGDYRLARPSQ